MINTLYNQIQTQEKATFDQLFHKNSASIPTKPELGALLRTLENEGKIFQLGNLYYDLAQFPDIEGYAQWNLTGFCWLSESNDMNAWGISFNPDDNLLSIYNKRDAHFGHYIQGKKVQIEDREFVYITSSKPTQDYKVIANYNKARNEWVILNSATNFMFKSNETYLSHFKNSNNENEIENGQVATFVKTIDSQSYTFERDLGNIQNFGIESEIISLLADIKEAPKADFKEIFNSKIKEVNKPFYTIDSIHTKDIDDAIWIEKDKEDYRLWVAIADVSSYVRPGDLQDIHASQTCSSFYLPHKTIHMLNSELAEKYCSLSPGIKKQSMVCEMLFDADGNLKAKDFYPAQILSHARLTYSDVDKLIDGMNPQESVVYKYNTTQKMLSIDDNKEITQSLAILDAFSQTQARTDERDYWVVEAAEYQLGEDGKIDRLYIKDESAKSQKMVETAMLAANICAAQFLYEKYPQFGMFRNQVEPPKDEFPKPAFYDVSNEGHWGLKTKFYTHFTSPIRRYCDLLVHRLIKNIVMQDEKIYSNEQLKEMADQINLQQYKAKQFDIKARNLLLPQYLEKLLQNKTFDEKLTVVDYSDTGVVARNKQLIEIFIPTFKLDKDFSKEVNKYLPKEGEVIANADKKAIIKKFNKEWMLFTKITNYNWTDDRKNAVYQTGRKHSKPNNRNQEKTVQNNPFANNINIKFPK